MLRLFSELASHRGDVSIALVVLVGFLLLVGADAAATVPPVSDVHLGLYALLGGVAMVCEALVLAYSPPPLPVAPVETLAPPEEPSPVHPDDAALAALDVLRERVSQASHQS